MRQQFDAQPAGIADDNRRLVEAPGLVVEQRAVKGGGVIPFQPQGLVGDQSEAGGMAFAKAVAGKADQLLVDGGGVIDALFADLPASIGSV